MHARTHTAVVCCCVFQGHKEGDRQTNMLDVLYVMLMSSVEHACWMYVNEQHHFMVFEVMMKRISQILNSITNKNNNNSFAMLLRSE